MFQLNSPLRMSSVVKDRRFLSDLTVDIIVAMICDKQHNTLKQIRYFIWKWHEITWHCRGKVLLPWSDVYISNVYYDRMSQLRTAVLSICVKCSMTCIITIIGAPLVVTRHRVFFFVDYQDENGHSIMNFSIMWLLKSLTRNTTCFLASLIITKYDFNTKSLTLWARRKA